MTDMTAEQAILHIKLGYKCTDPIVGTIAEAFAVLEALSAPRVPDGVRAALSEIEDAVAGNAMTAAQVFTRMRYMLTAAQLPAEQQDEIDKLRERVRELEEREAEVNRYLDRMIGLWSIEQTEEAMRSSLENIIHIAARLREGDSQ